jgi:hypothetical protein
MRQSMRKGGVRENHGSQPMGVAVLGISFLFFCKNFAESPGALMTYVCRELEVRLLCHEIVCRESFAESFFSRIRWRAAYYCIKRMKNILLQQHVAVKAHANSPTRYYKKV